jgi:hypothetical protein
MRYTFIFDPLYVWPIIVNITMAGMLRYGRCRLFQYTPGGEYLVYMLSYGVAIREYIEIR